jgi:hypothetical protein
MDENSSTFYMIVDGSQEGPLSFSQLVAAVAAGRLKGQDLVWKPGLPAWASAASVPGLFTPPKLVQEENQGKEQISPISPALDEPTSEAVAEQETPVAKATGMVTTGPEKKPSYLVRHWRGDLSLAVSYWLNGFLLNIAAVATVGAYVAYSSSETDDGITKSFVILNGVIALLIIVSAWQYVGVWRSASKNPARGGSRVWSGLAKVMVILARLMHEAADKGWRM